jgi:WD40 repeat protein
VDTFALSPDGTTLAVVSDGHIALWDTAGQDNLGRPLDHDAFVLEVVFSADGTTLAARGEGGEVTVWDVSDPDRPRQLGEPITVSSNSALSDFVLSDDAYWDSMVLSADGTILAAVGGFFDSSIFLWDVSDPEEPRQLGQPIAVLTDPVLSVALSTDGTTLATGTETGAITLWDLTDPDQPRQVGQPLGGFTTVIHSLAFTADGTTLIAGAEEGTVTLWDLTVLNSPREASVESACARAGGGLDREAWSRFVPEIPYRDTCAE